MKGDSGTWRALICLVKSLSSSDFVNLHCSDALFQCIMMANNEGGGSQEALLSETGLREEKRDLTFFSVQEKNQGKLLSGFSNFAAQNLLLNIPDSFLTVAPSF